ncbi:hypothetical protein K435DRAFT_877645 [Dendrothele bispora CBS 962.96]|uniref:Uncharacterized protein n=1 Tax=Dendrothele bispora (strain CBS 962.96) TaxID=1314807 RepID=A0A4S8KPI7_DENBC|nr:hypothetical protein K435DRAFT_877645 [Dendrothele bispora CBS 962.96]
MVCVDCHTGPFALQSFRKLMDGNEIFLRTTRNKVKSAMDEGCGLCHLLRLACQTRSAADGDKPPPDDIQFRLTVQEERSAAGFRTINPERVLYLSVHSPHDPSAAEIVARTPILEVDPPQAFKLV